MSLTCSSTSCTSVAVSAVCEYHWNFSNVPGLRTCSTTSPIEPSSGRCGECGMPPGSSHVSPSRMCTVRGRPSSITLTCMLPLIW